MLNSTLKGHAIAVERQAQAALTWALDWNAETYTIKKLNVGNSNHVFLASRGGEKFVVRVFDAGSQQMLNVDRGTELAFSTQAARLGIGPNVILLNDKFSVAEFSEGRHPENHELLAPHLLIPYMEALHRLHRSSLQARPFNAPKWIDDFVRSGINGGAEVPARLPEALRLMEVIKREVKRFPGVLVPCHNDQQGGNFLHTASGIMLLDWEYAGLNNPLYELGKFAAHHDLTTEQSEVLLATYDGTLTDSRRRQFHLQRAIASLWQAGWMFFRSAHPVQDFNYSGTCEKRLDQFFKLAATPEIAII